MEGGKGTKKCEKAEEGRIGAPSALSLFFFVPFPLPTLSPER